MAQGKTVSVTLRCALDKSIGKWTFQVGRAAVILERKKKKKARKAKLTEHSCP